MAEEVAKPISLDDVPINRFHIKMTVLTFGAHFTDGYSIGTISIALAALALQMDISPLWQGLLGSSALIGLFLGSLVTGWVSDKIGRQKIFLFSFVLIGLASFLQLFVTSLGALLALRILIGFGIGGDYSVGVTLLTEFVPRKARGVLVGCLSAVWTVGYVGATILGFYLVGSDAWRWLLASATVPSLIVLFLRIGTPESPRWLIRMGRREEAQKIVDTYIGPNVTVEENQVENLGYKMLFTKRYRKATAFSALFFAFDVIPYFAVYTFLPSILASFGLAEDFTTDLLLNIALLVGAAIGIWLTLKVTRRQFSTGAFAVCSIGLLTLTLAPGASPVVLIIAFALFTMAISAAGNLTAVFPAECLPTEVRSSGIGFATAVSRISSAISTFLLPLSLVGIGMTGTMAILAGVCVLGTIMCFAWAPNTEDKTLAEASAGEGADAVAIGEPAEEHASGE